MNHSPMAAPANGARYWLVAESEAAAHDDDRVRHRAGFFQNADDARDVGLLLADGDVNAVEGTEILVAGGFGRLVDARLVDHRVHADGGLARANGRR